MSQPGRSCTKARTRPYIVTPTLAGTYGSGVFRQCAIAASIRTDFLQITASMT
ncbi:MAG: hypothetical protein WC342_10610 [Methanoregula sp.]